MIPLYNGLRDWLVTAAAGANVIWQEGDGPIPARPAVTMKVETVVREGAPTYFPTKDSGIQPILQGGVLTLAVDVYGASGRAVLAIAEALAGSLNRTTVKDRLRSFGLAYVDLAMSPKDVSAIVGTSYEGRAHFDARFRANFRDDDPVGWIETVELTGTFSSGDFTYTETHVIGVT